MAHNVYQNVKVYILINMIGIMTINVLIRNTVKILINNINYSIVVSVWLIVIVIIILFNMMDKLIVQINNVNN